MKSSFRSTYGSPRVLTTKEVEIPEINADEVLIRVMASTVNRTDCAILTGEPFVMRFFTGLFKPKYFATGTDFAGIIENVGNSVVDYKIGDRVFGFHDEGIGSHTEYLSYSTKKPFGLIPENTSFETAAASLEGAHYAINFMNKVQLKKGDHLLIYGASGAIGSALVQLALTKEISISVVTNSETFEYFKSLGLKRVINYQTQDFTKIDDSFDYIFDAVGKISKEKATHLLKENGRYVTVDSLDVAKESSEDLKKLAEMYDQGELVAIIDKTYTLDEIVEANRYVDSGRKKGSVVIKVQ